MNSSKPYLIRALYDWINDNGKTPYLVVDAEAKGVEVPQEHVEEGQIVLNISESACRGLHIGNDRIVFSARFSGISHQIFVPPNSVLAIYAKENGRGMVFAEEEENGDDGDGQPSPDEPPKRHKKPKLTIVK